MSFNSATVPLTCTLRHVVSSSSLLIVQISKPLLDLLLISISLFRANWKQSNGSVVRAFAPQGIAVGVVGFTALVLKSAFSLAPR